MDLAALGVDNVSPAVAAAVAAVPLSHRLAGEGPLSLAQCLAAFTDAELLSGANMYACSACSVRAPAPATAADEDHGDDDADDGAQAV